MRLSWHSYMLVSFRALMVQISFEFLEGFYVLNVEWPLADERRDIFVSRLVGPRWRRFAFGHLELCSGEILKDWASRGET